MPNMERSSVFGLNKLQEEKKASLLKRLARQLSDPMIIVLLGAALISGITSAYAHESYVDTFIILFVVMVNAVSYTHLDVYKRQEYGPTGYQNPSNFSMKNSQEYDAIISLSLIHI